MANGVEVIVADGKTTLPGDFFRILTNKHYIKPLTLAPSTLNNVMFMTLGNQFDNIPESAILNRFVTKTCMTTYTYLTTYTQNGTTTIESREKVISNIATEERNTNNVTPLIASDMTFFKTPNLQVGEFSTTYTYYNTIMDEDVPIVATSKHVIVNKITAAEDYLKLIKPTPLPSPVFETNTYYSTVDFSKIINEDDTTRTINKQDVITQVIVTESLPLGRSPNTKNIHSSNVDVENEDLEPSNYDDIDLLNNIRKTHIMENNPTRIEHVPDRTAMPLHIYATKTYMTTFTYFTTLLQNKDKKSSTLVNSNTKVIENVITESIPSSLIPSHVLTSISKSLINNDKYTKKDLKTLITLKNGQKLEITAANILRPADMSTSTKVLSFDDENDLEVAANNLSPIQALHSSEEAENFVESSSEEIAVEDEESPPNKFVGSNNNRITNKTVASPAGNIGTGAVKFPNLLGGININGFSALGPVINAMAGLLQNNFGSNVKTNKVKAKVPQILQAVHALPLVAQAPPQFNKESEAIILKQSEAKNKYPLYIPVRGQGKYPAGHQNQFPPMMGSGIHISPGEVITANSDVIIGKPAVIGPKLPQNLEQPAATEQVPIGMQPPPFVPLQGNVNQRKPSFVKDIKNPVAHHQAQGQKNDDYYGPVPPREVSQNIHHQAIPVNSLPRAPLPQNLQKIQPNIPPQIRPTPELNQYNKFAQHDIQNYQQQQPAQRPNNNILIPRPQESNVGSNHGHFLKNNQNQNELNRDPSSHRIPQRQRPHQSSLNNYHGHGHHSHHNSHHNNHPLSIPIQSQASINFGGNSQNIIEIQKIPAVFSADLPPVAVPNRNNYYNQENSDHGIVTHNLPEIQDNSNGHPLLVDIQPSQVAKVLIPHGSSSVLVFGGVTEAHKSGQYFNDPPPYANEEIGIKSVNILADVSSKDKIILQNHNSIKNHGIQSIPAHTNTATYNVEDNIIVASEKQNLSPDIQPVAAYHGTAQEVNHNPVLSIHSQIINGSPATIHNIQPNVDNQQVDVISGQVIHYKPNTSEDHRRPQANPSVSMNVQPAPYFVGSSHHQQSHQSAPHNQPSHLQLQQQMFNKQKQLDHQQKVQYENQMKQFEHQQRLNYENQMKQNYEKHQQRIQFEHHMKKQADNQKRAQFERAQLENLKKQKQAEHQQRLNYELQMKQNHDKQQQNRHEYENQMKQNFDKQQKIHLEQHLKQQYEEQIKQKPPQSNIHSNNIPAFEIGPGYTDVHFVAHDRPSIDVIMQHHPIPVKAADQGSHISGQPQHQQLYKIQDLAHNHQEVVYANRPQPNYASNHEQTYHNSKPSEIPEDEDENESDGDGHVVQESMLHPILPSQEPAPSKEQDIQLNDFNREEIKSSTEKQVTTTTQWPRRETIRTTPKAPSTTQRPVHYVHTTLAPVVHKPVFITTVYPHLNYQFDNLPNLVNGLSPGQPFARPTESPRRPVFKQPQVTDNKFINSISHAMQPPPIIPLPLPKNNKRIIVPSVPVFGTKKPNLFKISMPINPMPENINNNANNQQTEEPFNPKYTKGVQYSSMFTTQTPPAKTSTQKQIVSSTTISPSTSQSPKSTEKSPSIYQLNLGEIQHNKGKPSVDEAPDIFDIKESNNPLNLDYVKHTDDEDSELMPPTINKPYQTISRKPTSSETPPTAQHKYKDQTGSSSELDNMKPPHTVSRGTRPPLSKLPSIDDIINLRAPPTTSSTHPARTENAEKSRQQPSYVNIRRPSTASTPNTTQLNRVSSTTAKPRVQWPNLKNNGPKDLASYIKIFEEKQKTTYKLPEQTTADSNEESHHVSVNPQDVFILGSEYELTDRSTIKPTPTLIRGRTSVKEMIPSVVSVPIESTSDQSAIVHNTQQVTPNLSQNDDRKLVLNRTKSFIERDSKITTKYITNTKTITLAKTKTEVINRSHGQFVTTRTSTIYDTITLTETETLLKSSIQPSPAHSSTSMQSTTMQQSTPKIIEVEGIFSEDDLDLDEFIINYEENKSENTITKVNSKEEEDRLKNRHPDENESIFVVMTDKKKNGLINLDPSIIKAPMSKEESTESDTNINEVVDVSRDEEDSNDGADHVLLGGILIASPTHSDKTKFNIINNQCIPDCRGTKNEVCQKLDGSMRCVCRPGFARMFPDRPCKPVYTYIMKIGLSRHGKERLAFKESLNDHKSSNYTELEKITHDGIDRMLMQSDLRDIYHSVRVIGFNSSANGNLIGKVYVQLSDNTDEKRLREIVKKYLRMYNFSLGGTDLFATPVQAELDAYDFDECQTEIYQDCSENAHCFNLQGTYTCSCREGFADISDNAIYPGRDCVPEQLGCEKCHYHGTCFTKSDDQVLCECFQWYTGKSCQINLKFLLFALVIIGTTLFTLLMICIIVTCVRKKNVHQTSSVLGIGPAMNILQRRISNTTGHHSLGSKLDKKAMIPDTSSEVSDESETVPYFRKKSNEETSRKLSVENVGRKKKSVTQNQNPLGSFSKGTTMDQRDRSLTVMIPRAKYHPSHKELMDLEIQGYKSKSSSSNSVNQSKLINYLDASPQTSQTKTKKNVPCEKSIYQQTGALVSAGFKVSATVGGSHAAIDSINKESSKSRMYSSQNEVGKSTSDKYYAVHKISTMSEQPIKLMHDEKSQISVVKKSYSQGNLIDSIMDDWLETGNTAAEMNMSEARSCDETIIQAPTKAIRNIYFKQSSHANNDEMATIAEREVGSTIFLPNQFLYKATTDRGSDISGFDSL